MKRFSNILPMADPAMVDSIALIRAVASALNNRASLTLVDSVNSIPTEMQMAVIADFHEIEDRTDLFAILRDGVLRVARTP